MSSHKLIFLLLAFFLAVFCAIVFAQGAGCAEKWVCSDWGACNDGVQSRLCVDESLCGTFLETPMENRNCESETFCGDTRCAGSETQQSCPVDCNPFNNPVPETVPLTALDSIAPIAAFGIGIAFFVVLIMVFVEFVRKKQ